MTQQYTDAVSNPFSSRIGRRIIIIMVILSGILTLTTTLLQIYWDYRQEINDINQKHYEVENVHSELLVSSLWSYDLALLQQHLDLLVNLPKIQYLEIQSVQTVLSAGEKVENYPITDTYPLVYFNLPDQSFETIGTIYVESN
ncbi:ATP-binding protein, partial [Vibrio metschnikovii]|nr:ATP-binding protein [Vibrio metschnikovii]